MSNIIAIASVEAGTALERLSTNAPLEERLRVAMRAVQHHWLATNEEDQFVAACEAVARGATPEERERLIDELRGMSREGAMLGAMQAGVPVNLEAMAAEAEATDHAEPVGLRALWAEARA